MMTPAIDRRRCDDAGFTLIELLVAMVLSLVIAFAVLDTLDNFSSSAAHQTRVTDANDQIRNTMDRIVADVRQARTIEVAGGNDFVYTVTDSATQTRRERICLDAASRVWRSSVTTSSPPTVPIAAGTACPTAGSGASEIANRRSANSSTNVIFRYDSVTPANVRSVGMTFALEAGDNRRNTTSTLRASAFVRSKGESAPAVTGGDVSIVCGSSGAGPLLTLATGVGPLTVSYTDVNGNALSGSAAAGNAVQLPAGAASGTVLANISSVTGVVTQLVKTLAC